MGQINKAIHHQGKHEEALNYKRCCQHAIPHGMNGGRKEEQESHNRHTYKQPPVHRQKQNVVLKPRNYKKEVESFVEPGGGAGKADEVFLAGVEHGLWKESKA